MKKFKVLLLSVFNSNQYEVYEEMGICFIASYLRKKGYEVMLKAATEDRVYHDMAVFKEFRPDIIGLPVYNISKESTFRACARLKQEIPQAFICIGGYLPTYYAKEIMEEAGFVDFLIRGEGEEALSDLLTCLEKGESPESVKSLSYRKGGQIIHNEDKELIKDLNILPFPSRDILVDNKLRIAQISSSRGCVRNCSFCCTSEFWKHRWRGRDVKNVVDEIEEIVNKCGMHRFFFIDSSFEDPDKHCKRMCDLAEEMVKRNLKTSYHAELRAEIHKKIQPGMIELLIESGLCGVLMGIESANEHDLKLYNKFAGQEDNIASMELFRKYPDINVSMGFINFNPYSTVENLKENLAFLSKYGFATFYNLCNRYMMFRGTKLYEKVKRDGLLKNSGTFVDDFAYNYVNKDIGTLVEFIIDYLKPLDQKFCGPKRFYYYALDYKNILAHCKRYFSVRGEQEIYEKVTEHEAQVNSILSEISDNNAKWFGELLTLVEKGWDVRAALQIMDKYIKVEDLRNSAVTIDSGISKLYSYITKKGFRYDLTI